MVVHPVNPAAVPSTPMRPASTTFSLAARMKRGGGARRALSNLGNNDTQANLRLAESLLTVSQEKFAKKWNFDPVNTLPLAPGRYLWSQVTNSRTPTEPKEALIIGNNKDILTCLTLPKSGFTNHSDEPRVPELHGVANIEPAVATETTSSSEDNTAEDISVQDNNDSGIVSDESISESPVPARSNNTTQTTITDYLRCSKKRLLVVDDEDVTLLPASKRQQQLGGAGPAHSTPTSTTAATSVPEPAQASPLHK